MSLKKKIQEKLEKIFTPVSCEVQDLSSLHKGHTGYSPKGETHFKVILVSSFFSGKNRVERHQMVHKALAEEIKEIHAMEFVLRSPEEHVV
ncbi:MAG: hypothetical protein A2977_02615 [Alphaproteobacteria bacterium RIFCSPLOWO2_01_FULL_45_8]|nr:MAG: hypothetical protein A3K20_02760 [Alphaproteobacteria bacterium GWA1_45_9]OFW89581.1 MAG: hypothetical protein A2621_01540 [Alphaproteobacteria bacterium RIFCSPHIGHO2_01_FULL_41_14]OFW96067.1 MAG: hypothetical protein A2977_02615 [Alphaproteobacteria bacterium RIFCSPLOWO2_01_FULL_45_8]HCI48454.1 BolA family transcriptional regulator [Holosporales bacterium]